MPAKQPAEPEAKTLDTPLLEDVIAETESRGYGPMMEKAISAGQVEALSKLMGLQEQWEKRQARKAFDRAFSQFQAEVDPVQRKKPMKKATGSGGGLNYKFADLAAIHEAVSDPLTKHGFSFSWDAVVEDRDKRQVLTVTCKLRHRDGHVETSTFAMPVEKTPHRPEPQDYAATYTYCKRYTLIGVLGLMTAEEDTDGIEGRNRPEPITEQQAITLEEWLTETNSDKAKFLKWIGAKKISEIAAHDYKRAVAQLKKKRDEQRAAEADA